MANLLWILPMALALEIYFRLVAIYPWLFGALVVAFLWHAATGRDLIPGLFDTDQRDGIFGGRRFGFNLHRALAWAAGACTLYIVYGTVMLDPKYLQIPKRPGTAGVPAATRESAPPAPPAAPAHPAPNGQWPAVAAYLVPPADREAGQARIRVSNDASPAPVFIKLCLVVQETCVPQRQLYLPPQTSLLIDNLVDGNYRLLYIENQPPQFATGQSAVIRVNAGRAHTFTWQIPAATLAGEPGQDGGFAAVERTVFDAVR